MLFLSYNTLHGARCTMEAVQRQENSFPASSFSFWFRVAVASSFHPSTTSAVSMSPTIQSQPTSSNALQMALQPSIDQTTDSAHPSSSESDHFNHQDSQTGQHEHHEHEHHAEGGNPMRLKGGCIDFSSCGCPVR